MNRTEQINKARELGKKAYLDGLPMAPFFNEELNAMIGNRPVGCTPPDEASTIEIFENYSDAWVAENLAN